MRLGSTTDTYDQSLSYTKTVQEQQLKELVPSAR